MKAWHENLRPYLAYAGALAALFAAVYGGAGYRAGLAPVEHRLYADWELSLPFVPAMIYPYVSLAAAFALPLFTLSRRELRAFAGAFALATLAAGTFFLAFPARVAFPRPATVPGHELLYAALYSLDSPYNAFPSLHAALGTLTLLAAARGVRAAGPRLGLMLWLTGLLAATVLVHQHHIADLGAGLGLGTLCYACFVRWSARPLSPASASPAAAQGSAPSRAAAPATSADTAERS
jgi:membrane-associated phospholipid phosphatase